MHIGIKWIFVCLSALLLLSFRLKIISNTWAQRSDLGSTPVAPNGVHMRFNPARGPGDINKLQIDVFASTARKRPILTDFCQRNPLDDAGTPSGTAALHFPTSPEPCCVLASIVPQY
ncbi:hypothetical protein JB92DRAFT_3047966 [Gautieria morchelliformis]|nr:hypothetical protein JB92DRAFT_3047966 [Gautieria morchelliformis]